MHFFPLRTYPGGLEWNESEIEIEKKNKQTERMKIKQICSVFIQSQIKEKRTAFKVKWF